MDKRWISILIIIIIACGCGYLIVQFSDTVGNAVVDVHKTTLTIPSDFSKDYSAEYSVKLIHKGTPESIYVKDLGKEDNVESSFKNDEKKLAGYSDIEVLSNNTTKMGDIEVHTVYYTNITNSEAMNMSNSYFYSFEHTYFVKMSGFDSLDRLNEKLEKVVTALKPDYKQSQD